MDALAAPERSLQSGKVSLKWNKCSRGRREASASVTMRAGDGTRPLAPARLRPSPAPFGLGAHADSGLTLCVRRATNVYLGGSVGGEALLCAAPVCRLTNSSDWRRRIVCARPKQNASLASGCRRTQEASEGEDRVAMRS